MQRYTNFGAAALDGMPSESDRARFSFAKAISRQRASSSTPASVLRVTRGAYLMNLGLVPYSEAFELQRSLAGAVSQGAVPETVILLEHPPVVTIGRRTETDVELHIPEDAAVEVAETDRGGKSTFHGPGQPSATRSSTSRSRART